MDNCSVQEDVQLRISLQNQGPLPANVNFTPSSGTGTTYTFTHCTRKPLNHPFMAGFRLCTSAEKRHFELSHGTEHQAGVIFPVLPSAKQCLFTQLQNCSRLEMSLSSLGTYLVSGDRKEEHKLTFMSKQVLLIGQ